MSKFDFNNAGDFATATLSAVASPLLALQSIGRDPSEWDIKEGSYNNILFHVFRSKSEWQGALPRVTDTGGRRKVKYKFPYVDGQTTDDLGRESGTFQMEIVIFGERYAQGLAALLAEFDKPTPGTLVHPFRGVLNCVVSSYEISYSHDQRKAAGLNVTFEEHNYSIGQIAIKEEKSVKSLLGQALSLLGDISNIISQVTGAVGFVQSFINTVKRSLEAYQASYAKLLGRQNATFNAANAQDFPTLYPTQFGGNQTEDGQIVSDTLSVATTANTALALATLNALAIEELKKEVAAVRAQLSALIALMQTGNGALEFYDAILTLREGGNLIQQVFDAGVAASQPQIVNYITPRVMSIREIAFENGVSISRVQDIDFLNREIESVNYIPKGTIIRVPIA